MRACSVAQLRPTLCDPMDYSSTRLLCRWDSPGKKTVVGCFFLLQEIFPTQESYPCLLHLLHGQAVLYHSANWEAQLLEYWQLILKEGLRLCSLVKIIFIATCTGNGKLPAWIVRKKSDTHLRELLATDVKNTLTFTCFKYLWRWVTRDSD